MADPDIAIHGRMEYVGMGQFLTGIGRRLARQVTAVAIEDLDLGANLRRHVGNGHLEIAPGLHGDAVPVLVAPAEDHGLGSVPVPKDRGVAQGVVGFMDIHDRHNGHHQPVGIGCHGPVEIVDSEVVEPRSGHPRFQGHGVPCVRGVTTAVIGGVVAVKL
jgi:hypothetical protein